MMSNSLTLLSVLLCGGMMLAMFGGATVLWLARRTPLGRLSWFERRARRARGEAEGASGTSA
jgi:hypothetical protein